MKEENNDIFLAGNDALGYLTGPMHKKKKKLWHLFGAIHLVCANLMTDFSILPTPRCAHMYAFRVPPPFAIWSHRFDTPTTVLTLLFCYCFLILLSLTNSEIYDSP